MSDKPSIEEINKWHRWHAIEANNQCWTLVEKPELSQEEGDQLLDLAHTARRHWLVVGTKTNAARADMLLAAAHARVGQGCRAVRLAQSTADTLLNCGDCPDWEQAFIFAVLAWAHHRNEDAEQHAANYQKAKQLGEVISSDQEKEIFNATFANIPAP